MKTRYLITALAIACLGSFLYAQNRSQAARTLEERVTELESRVQALEGKPGKGSAELVVTSRWQDIALWRRKMSRGMPKSEVLALFGEPTKVSVFGASSEQWYYGYPSGGRIMFGAGERVDSWSEPTP